MHPYRPGDAVWVKEWNVQLLKPLWGGPFVVILSIPTAVKVVETAPWIHRSQVKPTSLEWEYIPDLASLSKVTLWNAHALPRQDSASWETTEDYRQQNDSSGLVSPESD
jgi:hypothetical protein